MRKVVMKYNMDYKGNMRIILIFLLFIASPVWAQKSLGNSKDWQAHSIVKDGVSLCYAVSYPVSKKGNYKRRGKPYFAVTKAKGKPAEISHHSGYDYQKGSKVQLVVDDDDKILLYTTPEIPFLAWAHDTDADSDIIKLMKAGKKISAKGTSKLGTYSLDSYSLMGFSKIYKIINDTCK